MARFNRIEVCTTMKETGMIPVFYHADLSVCQQIISACHDGGARVFEFTNRGDFAHEIFGQLIKWTTEHLPKMILGVGSVVDAATASLYIQLGANFVVSPVLVEEVVKVCNRRKVAVSPGCGSLTEISKAEELGVEIVKIFPATEVGGPSFVKSILGPCPWTSIMPTGGVAPDETNLRKWFEAGVACVGMGSKLMTKKANGAFDYSAITKTTQQAIGFISAIRKTQEQR